MGTCKTKAIQQFQDIHRYSLVYSGIFRHNKAIHKLFTDIQEHSEDYVTLVYSEPWHIQNKRPYLLAYLEPWYIQNICIFRTLGYSEREAYTQPCQTSAMDRFIEIMKILFFTIFRYDKSRPQRDRSQYSQISVQHL